MRFIKTPSILFFLFIFFSCTENLNFDDTELNIGAVHTSPLVFFTLDQNDFFDRVNDVEIINVEVVIGDFTLLQSEGVADNLIRIDFDLKIRNEFTRTITSTVNFLDENDNVVQVVAPFIIPAGDLNYRHRIVQTITPVSPLLRAKRIRVALRIDTSSGSPIRPDDPRIFDLKSTGTYYFEI